MRTFILLASLLIAQTLLAQRQNNNWYFGGNAGLSFKTAPPTPLTDGQVRDSYGASASISHKITGDLLFYTNGDTVWNYKHLAMKNSAEILGGNLDGTGYHNLLILPHPSDSLKYYIIMGHDAINRYLRYVEISLKDPEGEVVSQHEFEIEKLYLGRLGQCVTATIDSEGTGYWLLTHQYFFHRFYAFHLTAKGIDTIPIISTYNDTLQYSLGHENFIKISPNSKKIVFQRQNLESTNLDSVRSYLFDFNNATGKVSNCDTLEISNIPGSWAFSSDNTKLYRNKYKGYNSDNVPDGLVQYDISLSNINKIRNSRSIISAARFDDIALAPNGKIYCNLRDSTSLSVINKPNESASKCDLQLNALPLSGKQCGFQLPNCIDSYFDAGKSTICLRGSTEIGIDSVTGSTYSWSPTYNLNNPTIAKPLASPTKTTLYTVTITDKYGIQTYRTHLVKVDTLKLSVQPVSPICIGASVQLSASGGDTYQWTPTIGLDSANKPNPIAKPTVTTRYKVLVTKGGCIDSAFVNVVVNQRPIARAGEDKITCAEGNRTQLGDTARAGESYLWSPPDGLSDPRIANPSALPKANTKYLLKVWNATCPDTAYDEVIVTIIDKTQALISNDTAICRGGSVPLLARGGLTYSWFPTTGLSDPTIQDPIASPLVTTRYKVLVAIGDCVDSAFVTVSIYSGAHAGADKTVCMGASAELGEKPEAGNTYSWQPSTYLDNPNIANPQCTPQTDMQYILTVTSESGCVATDTVQVRIGTIVAKVTNDTAICSGTSVQLLATGGATYKWSPSIGLSDTTIENPTASPNITTTYKVNVSSGTCEDSAFVTITVNPQPTANAGEDKTLCLGASAEIGEAAQAGFTYNWLPTSGLDDATKANPTASPTSTTQYILTVSGNGGCTSSDTVLVTIGTIKAIVSNDTSICEGASAKLFASGGAKYEWSPSAGLDNSSIANPTANPTSTTKYKVLVSSGTCIDSNFVTVTILLPPTANAGDDTTICLGASTQIGIVADPTNKYSWSPLTGLLSPTASQTSASPTTTTTYTLQVTNPAGCVKSDEVTVTVNSRSARSFTLQPDTVIILPGKEFTTSLEIPSGVNNWRLNLKYDSLLVKFKSITGAQAIPDDLKGELLISGNGGSRSIPITFDAYLPHTSDTIYPVKLSVDTSKVAECETWSSTGNILMLADYCGKNIRVVSSTGKKYYLTIKDRSIDFGVGLSGNVRLEVFDYVGNSMLVVSDGALEAGEYSAALDLPVGVYYCRMSAGMYESVGKVMILR